MTHVTYALTTSVVLLAQAADDALGAGSISISPNSEGGPGGPSLDKLMNYIAWLGMRVLTIAFIVSLITAGFGRWRSHGGAEAFGKAGMAWSLICIAGLAGAAAFVNFASLIGSLAGSNG